jgi:hypothetical protein
MLDRPARMGGKRSGHGMRRNRIVREIQFTRDTEQDQKAPDRAVESRFNVAQYLFFATHQERLG